MCPGGRFDDRNRSCPNPPGLSALRHRGGRGAVSRDSYLAVHTSTGSGSVVRSSPRPTATSRGAFRRGRACGAGCTPSPAATTAVATIRTSGRGPGTASSAASIPHWPACLRRVTTRTCHCCTRRRPCRPGGGSRTCPLSQPMPRAAFPAIVAGESTSGRFATRVSRIANRFRTGPARAGPPNCSLASTAGRLADPKGLEKSRQLHAAGGEMMWMR